VATPARAEEQKSPSSSDFFSTTYSGFGGLHFYAGVAAWPKQVGISFSLGLFHQHRLGFDLSANVPLLKSSTATDPFVLSALSGRFVLLREGISGPWVGGRAPTVGLIVSLRAGLGLLDNVGGSGPPIALISGVGFELLVGRTLLVGLRPTVGLRSRNDADSSSIQALPMLDLSIGWVPEAAYSN
jgi:hypothetical protein